MTCAASRVPRCVREALCCMRSMLSCVCVWGGEDGTVSHLLKPQVLLSSTRRSLTIQIARPHQVTGGQLMTFRLLCENSLTKPVLYNVYMAKNHLPAVSHDVF